MPGATPNKNYPYPLGGERVDVAGDIKKLAMAVDTSVAGLDTPWATAPLAAGWQGAVRYRRLSNIVFVSLEVVDLGGLPNNIANLPPGFRPKVSDFGTTYIGFLGYTVSPGPVGVTIMGTGGNSGGISFDYSGYNGALGAHVSFEAA